MGKKYLLLSILVLTLSLVAAVQAVEEECCPESCKTDPNLVWNYCQLNGFCKIGSFWMTGEYDHCECYYCYDQNCNATSEGCEDYCAQWGARATNAGGLSYQQNYDIVEDYCKTADNYCHNVFESTHWIEGEECTCLFCRKCNYFADVCESGECTEGCCGNGVVECGEECDDGNNVNGDGCQADCTLPICNEYCKTQLGCGDGLQCYSSHCRNPDCLQDTDCVCYVKECGNGILDAGEECDDGNKVNGDGCNADCTKPELCNAVCTSQWGCDGGLQCYNSHCRNPNCLQDTDCLCYVEECGNGVLDAGEECDDGNNVDGDGCDADCTKPDNCDDYCDPAIGCSGYDCYNNHCRDPDCLDEADCECPCPECGDGNLDPGEECDPSMQDSEQCPQDEDDCDGNKYAQRDPF